MFRWMRTDSPCSTDPMTSDSDDNTLPVLYCLQRLFNVKPQWDYYHSWSWSFVCWDRNIEIKFKMKPLLVITFLIKLLAQTDIFNPRTLYLLLILFIFIFKFYSTISFVIIIIQVGKSDSDCEHLCTKVSWFHNAYEIRGVEKELHIILLFSYSHYPYFIIIISNVIFRFYCHRIFTFFTNRIFTLSVWHHCMRRF